MGAASSRIAVVGDRDAGNPTHIATDASLAAAGLAFDWLGTDAVSEDALARYDGVVAAPGSPYRDMDGALRAIRFARERGVPLVGT